MLPKALSRSGCDKTDDERHTSKGPQNTNFNTIIHKDAKQLHTVTGGTDVEQVRQRLLWLLLSETVDRKLTCHYICTLLRWHW